MANEVIREVRVDPPVPAEYVVFLRADIERFIAAAHRTVARLEAELVEERHRAPIIDLSDGAAFFESLREPGAPLIAGAERAHRLA